MKTKIKKMVQKEEIQEEEELEATKEKLVFKIWLQKRISLTILLRNYHLQLESNLMMKLLASEKRWPQVQKVVSLAQF